jgi:hypothetical protein
MNISTALSALGKGIVDIGGSVGSAVLAAAPAFAPLIAQAIAPKPKLGSYQAQPYGGSYPMANVPTTYLPGGAIGGMAAITSSLGDIFGGQPIFGGAQVPSTQGQAIFSGPARMPRTVEGKDAQGRTRIYVLAPMVKYRVSIHRAGRRRCHAGGR